MIGNSLKTTSPQVYSKEEYLEKRVELNGIALYDGDGDGTGAAAIWLAQKTGNYLAITNTRKNKRDLVNDVFDLNLSPITPLKVGIFDIDAEQNLEGIEKLLNMNSEIDFFDHHTRIQLPGEINNYSKPDSRETSTASLVYLFFKERYPTAEETDKRKAAHLAILGLANDGKSSGIEKFSQEIAKEEIERLTYLGKVLNYSANLGNTLDFREILSQFLKTPNIITYLNSDPKITSAASNMENSVQELIQKVEKTEVKNNVLYTFPSQTPREIITSNAFYQNFMNQSAAEDPTKYHLGIFKMADGKYGLAIRGENALDLAEKIAKHYDIKPLGRKTAAGFGTSKEINTSGLLRILGEI